MIKILGEETSKKAIQITLKSSQVSAELIIYAMKYITNERRYGKQTLKELNKKGKALQDIPISKVDLRAIQRYLKKDGIDYAIKKDLTLKDTYTIYFKGQDINQIERVLKNYAKNNFKGMEKNIREKVKEAEIKAERHNKAIKHSKEKSMERCKDER